MEKMIPSHVPYGTGENTIDNPNYGLDNEAITILQPIRERDAAAGPISVLSSFAIAIVMVSVFIVILLKGKRREKV